MADPRNTVIPFGKYRNLTLGQIEEQDFDYIRWLATQQTKVASVGNNARQIMADPKYKNVSFETVMPFGKYEGRTLREINSDDPDYLQFLLDEVDLSDKLKADIEFVVEA